LRGGSPLGVTGVLVGGCRVYGGGTSGVDAM
jgi:hypothetical protein